MIQLKSFLIKSRFKNISNLFINFEKGHRITLLIGNNGSGKSNIIEALSSAFAGLYNNDFNPIFSYELKYQKDDADITISYNHAKNKNKYNFSVPDTNKDWLPTQIVSIYSGEELRLWNNYYFRFYDSFMTGVISNKKRYNEKQRMEFINKYHWNIALLTMIVSDLPLSDILGDIAIQEIVFEFSKENINNMNKFDTNEVVEFSKALYNSSILKSSKNGNEIKSISLDQFKKVILDTHTELFRLLSIALLPKDINWKLINKLEIVLENGIKTEELSEGEKKQILIKFITRIFADENSILLLDEPDSHIHILNKQRIRDLLFDPNSRNNPYVQSVITTHSPTLTRCFKNENLLMLSNTENKEVAITDSTMQECIYNLTNGFWSSPEQNIFLATPKPIVLFVEGAFDVDHINNAFNILKDEYSDLEFEIFNMNSACNIPYIMKGLRTSEKKPDKLYIGIFDDDDEGKKQLSETKCQFKNEEDKVIEQNTKSHKEGFYAIKYPKHSEHKSNSFTVENFYDTTIIQNSYTEAIQKLSKLGKLNGKSITSINELITEKTKQIVRNKSNILTNKEDFKNFCSLFQIIREIKKDYDDKKKESEKTEHQEKATDYYFIEARGVKAKGYLPDGSVSNKNSKIVICKGSEAISTSVSSCSKPIVKMRDKLINDKVLKLAEDKYIFVRDYTFNSVSTAGCVILGRNTNGWEMWKDKTGKTLDKIFRG
jgi:ABC-type cobalamin/Fe3+-siderophores transport system ATPase subunit